jgi:hypothetical protein
MTKPVLKAAFLVILSVFLTSCHTRKSLVKNEYPSYSGIYPHLAFYNNEDECGTGAVVPWANKLWVITYGPHLPLGSSDKLFEIGQDLSLTTRPESIGGTPANRLIHKESNQLFIGPYVIDNRANVRVIPYNNMPGRHTGTARHLFEPASKVYYGTMEEGFYEVDVNTLTPTLLYADDNQGSIRILGGAENLPMAQLPGAHGKGLYSGQGVLVYSNNGERGPEALRQFDIESGSLAEWDGNKWKTVRRAQFVEVTGPGGIHENPNPETDPVWATGWDHRSVLLGVRHDGTWTFYRMPKASHSYDGAHGWNTEWPRIRNVGTPNKPDYLMTMHGMFWRFPGYFTPLNAAGIRPRSAYLKVIGDYTRWNNQLVFGCDDAARKEFLNTRSAKGGIGGPGQSNSNLWFTSFDTPDHLGPKTASGAVWINEKVDAAKSSDPFLFAGWEERSAWIHNDGNRTIKFSFDVDQKGDNKWQPLKSVEVSAGESKLILFDHLETGEWIRVTTDFATTATVSFHYATPDLRITESDELFVGLSKVNDTESMGGLLYSLGDNRRSLGIAARNYNANGDYLETGYYELDSQMNLVKKADSEMQQYIKSQFAIPKQVIYPDESSVLIVDDSGRRWRLPLGDEKYTELTEQGSLRICREVATERDLFSCHGTFYELPAENADGYAKIRPVASHDFRINDYASYRGLLILSGINPDYSKNNSHIIKADDGGAAVWAGAIDDLWKLGKPTGEGGPWKNTDVKANIPSDPYLFGFYDQRSLQIQHNENQPVTFTIQFEPIGHGPWMTWKEVTVSPGETFEMAFPSELEARWIRFFTNKDCKATTWLKYQ